MPKPFTANGKQLKVVMCPITQLGAAPRFSFPMINTEEVQLQKGQKWTRKTMEIFSRKISLKGI